MSRKARTAAVAGIAAATTVLTLAPAALADVPIGGGAPSQVDGHPEGNAVVVAPDGTRVTGAPDDFYQGGAVTVAPDDVPIGGFVVVASPDGTRVTSAPAGQHDNAPTPHIGTGLPVRPDDYYQGG
jgi:hypothetical protein